MGNEIREDFLLNVTFKREIAANRFNFGRFAMAAMLALITIGLIAPYAAVMVTIPETSLAKLFLECLFTCNCGIVTFVIYDDIEKLSQRKYVAQSIKWVMRNNTA
jgi:hypothetical protein